ncbi:UPF0481 protein [Salix suchowensis]|nr:UPF0481 protein [Salix suchowensis]
MEEYKESENNRKPNIPEVPEPNIPKVPEQNIHEVPGKLKEKKEECYRPLAFSIGPYHYSDREGKLQQVEKLKARMMVEFVKDPVDDSGASRKDFYVNVKEELQKARGCYDESITEKFSDEEFIKMMFIDGCFILQFMHCLNDESEKLEMSDRQIFHVKRDLLLLENQLPFVVLDSLRKQSHPTLLKCFYRRRNSKNVSLDWSPPPGKTLPDHLLQLLYYKSMYHYNHKKAQPGSRGHVLYYSAKNLKKVGILFRPRWTAGAITDVKFKSSSTDSLLLNLVAYESSAALDQLWVSSYILFMDSLIDDAEDVEELRSNGIIINYLGADQKVTNLFNDMGKSLTHHTYDTAAYNDMGRSLTHDTYDTVAYNDVKMAINKQCESIVKRWAYEWKKTYFSNPWTFITVLAASFGLCLTATHTYYTRFPPK